MSKFCKINKMYDHSDFERMRGTVMRASKWPNNYNSDSQLRMVERFKYLLNMSDELVLQSENQKKLLIQTRLTLEVIKTMEAEATEKAETIEEVETIEATEEAETSEEVETMEINIEIH